MPPEVTAKSTLSRTLADTLGDFSDLIAKQIQLAKAELTANINSRLLASVWFIAAALLFLLAALLVIEAAVFSIASMGIALHWASLIVAAALAAIGAGLLFYARSAARDALIPERSVRQISRDIIAAKEQLK